MAMPTPQQEHQWLQQFVGEWTVEGEGTMGPDQPSTTWQGTESVRSIGGMTTMMTLGYDPQKQRFVGAFIGSMMTNLWIYDGALDADHRVLTSRMQDENGQWHQFMTTHYRRVK